MKPKSTEGHGQRGGSGRVKPVVSLGADKTTAGDPLGLGFNLVFPGSADQSEGKAASLELERIRSQGCRQNPPLVTSRQPPGSDQTHYLFHI